jgi:acyl-[acyl-carrier-protein]-phospholipid O-acyltransferase/long-chain-fatty-acid--[acyl-carrier-protein] ligase
LNPNPRSDLRSFHLLNATQFLGALNDNIFKLLVIFMLINLKGPDSTNTILSLAGAIFVIPFLLFSSGAGILADRISKQTIIIFTKVFELFCMSFGLIAILFESEIGAYTALFFMATQSALFGPSKYGIILELVDPKMVSKANGTLTSSTYLAIILGTFLASFIADITNKNFVLEGCFCLFISVIGLLTSLGIRRTAPQNSPKKINPLFLYEIYQTVRIGWKVPHLITTIFGSSFFLFIGAFTQLNIIPFAMQSLGLTEVGGGYLFLAMAVGIAIGSVLAGQISKDKVEPGLSCIAGFFVALFFIALHFFSFSLVATLLILTLLGMFGGAFLIPFDSYIQLNSPQEHRGQLIAANNFFSFIGVLAAAVALYLFSEKWGFTASSGFFLVGLLTLFLDLVLTGRLSTFFFPFFVKKILKRFRVPILRGSIPDPENILLLQSNSWLDALLLFAFIPNLKILVPGKPFRQFPWFTGLIDSIRMVPMDISLHKPKIKLFAILENLQQKGNIVCIFMHKTTPEDVVETYQKALSKSSFHFAVVHGKKEKVEKKFLGRTWIQKQLTFHFDKE